MRFFKSLLSFLLAFTLLTAGTSCSDKTNSIHDLQPQNTTIIDGVIQMELPSDKFLLEIEKDYRAFEKKNGRYDTAYHVKNYFGFYDGAVPVILEGEDLGYIEEITNDTIDGYEFQYPNGNQMEIWFFGTFYSLSEAYEEEIITKDELNLLHQVYYDKSEKVDHGFEKYNDARQHFTRLSPSLQKKLKKSYKKISNFPLCLYDFEVKKWSDYCYGNYNGCVVIFSPGDLTVEGAYSVAGITFTHSQNINLYGYYKGKMYSLKETYEKGYITKADIAKAEENHRAIQQYMHWKRWGI